MLVGEFTPNGDFLLQFFGTVGFVALVISKVYDLFNRKEAQKREVTFSTEWARKGDMERLERQVSDIEEKMESAIRDIRGEMKEDRDIRLRAGEERASKIHARIDLVLEAVAELRGRIDR